MQHRHMKHIKIDIQFIQDQVALGFNIAILCHKFKQHSRSFSYIFAIYTYCIKVYFVAAKTLSRKKEIHYGVGSWKTEDKHHRLEIDKKKDHHNVIIL